MSHARDFGLESGDTRVAERLIFDYRTADLNAADRALCDHAVLLTLRPGKCGESHLGSLRRNGLDDDQITIATQVIAYFNYINRVADGLGVDPEDWMTPSPKEWQQRKAHDWDALPSD